MSSAAGPSQPPARVASEDIVNHKAEICLSNTIVKTGIGFSAGVVLSVLLFRRRSFPVWLGAGFGLGHGWTDCERSFNPVSIPGLRVVPTTTTSSSESKASEKAQGAGSAILAKAQEIKEGAKDKVGEIKQRLA